MTVRGDAADVDITEPREYGDGGVRAERIRRAGTLFKQRPRRAQRDAARVCVIGRDADEPPLPHHAAELASVRLSSGTGGVAEHNCGERPAAARFQENALEINGRAVEHAGQGPSCSGCGLWIAGDEERGPARKRRCSLRSTVVARRRPIQQREY